MRRQHVDPFARGRAEFVALMTAKMLFEANLATLKTTGEMQKSLIDVNG